MISGTHPPEWLYGLAVTTLVITVVCAAVILLDILSSRKHKMAVMNVVWPVTVRYFGPDCSVGLLAIRECPRLPARWLIRKGMKESM